MSLKNDENATINPRELIFLLAIAGRLDAQSKLLAQKLDNDRWIYHSYAVVDSLSSSYSMFKYFFEVFLANSNDPDLMHHILTSPEGIAAVAGEALFLVAFAFLASYFDGDKKSKNDPVKRFIISAWPYFRDGMKGLKNAYKGWKSVVQVLNVLGGVDIKYMIIPVGLVLGILAAANRFWLRNMVEKRKVMMGANAELLLSIQKLTSLTKTERQTYLKKIQYQDEQERIHSFFAVGMGGLIDGLYLYAGVMGLALLAPPAYIAMVVISALYIIACVVSRIYEEYDFQLRLLATQTKCKLALVSKELETTYANLLTLQAKVNKSGDDLDDIKRLKKEISGLIEEFEGLRRELKSQTMPSYITAGLMGLKHGLFAYGVTASILFMVVSVCSLTAAVFPPALLIACIVSGLVFMMALTAYTTHSHYQNLKKQKKEEEEPFHKLVVMKENIERDAACLTVEEFNESVKDGTKPQTPPPFYFQEWFEVLRSFFSGLSKGNNFANFVATPFHDSAPQDHAHDSPVMTMLTMSSAALFSIVLALRALARGFGRTPLGQINPAAGPTDQGPRISPETKAARGSSELIDKPPLDSLPRNRSVLNLFSIFNRPQPPRPKSQTFAIQTVPISVPGESRVQGLM